MRRGFLRRRPRLSGDRDRPATGATATGIRRLEAADVPAVLELWADNARQHFGEVLSYDRWGPGVPVPHGENTTEVDVQTLDPRQAVREHLQVLVDHPAAFSLVASTDGFTVGFLTAAVVRVSPVGSTLAGHIEQLYVAQPSRRQRIGTRLVAEATVQLREMGARIFRADVNPASTGALRFWHRQSDWVHDAHSYRCYD